MNKNNLPNNLYELRRSQGLSQEEFAEKLAVSRQAVSKWERGEAYPDTENLIAISEMFGVSIDELLRGDVHTAASNTCGKGGSEADAAEDKKTENSDFGINVEIGDNISVHVGKRADACLEDDDNDDDDDDDRARKNGKLAIWYKVPYPIIVTAVFLAVGLLCDAWDWAWTLFMTIPLYYSLLDSIEKRRAAEFAYPVLVAFLYCLFGMLYSVWHPGWIIFITIPIYYPIAEAIDKHNMRK